MIVSNVCGLLALVVLHRLVTLEFGDAVAGRTVFLLLAFPSAFFLAAPFTHSLFLLLAVTFLYALRQQRWWLAGALAGLASATRPFGVLLAAPFVFEYLRVRMPAAGAGSFGRRLWGAVRLIRLDAAAVLLVPSGLAAFAVYCWVTLGDPFIYTKVQVGNWNKILTWPGHTLWLAMEQLAARPLAENYGLLIDLAATLFAGAMITLALVGPWKVEPHQRYLVVFALSVLLLPLCLPGLHDNPLQSITRYVLDAAVLFAVLARIGTSRTVERLYVLPAFALQCGFLLMYLRGFWVF
jgi:Gpi18-like mannosyltransferase